MHLFGVFLFMRNNKREKEKLLKQISYLNEKAMDQKFKVNKERFKVALRSIKPIGKYIYPVILSTSFVFGMSWLFCSGVPFYLDSFKKAKYSVADIDVPDIQIESKYILNTWWSSEAIEKPESELNLEYPWTKNEDTNKYEKRVLTFSFDEDYEEVLALIENGNFTEIENIVKVKNSQTVIASSLTEEELKNNTFIVNGQLINIDYSDYISIKETTASNVVGTITEIVLMAVIAYLIIKNRNFNIRRALARERENLVVLKNDLKQTQKLIYKKKEKLKKVGDLK